ncbi:hypothetical protein [Paraburkholderia sp. GAS32]|uniref:hypothetical protein n=1 Tax=Paraburkholderia sp. GAS32 TaxID=3035129 RepID=UPI003D1AA028
MSPIVAARFTRSPAAEDAAQWLFNGGLVEEDATLFFVNSSGQHVTIGAVVEAVVGVAIFAAFLSPLPVSLIAAGVGAYVGSLVGAMSRTLEAGKPGHWVSYYEEIRDSGVLVAVHVSPDNQLDAARVLRDTAGATIERATGRWQQGRWADFDPRKRPEPLSEFNEKRP